MLIWMQTSKPIEPFTRSLCDTQNSHVGFDNRPRSARLTSCSRRCRLIGIILHISLKMESSDDLFGSTIGSNIINYYFPKKGCAVGYCEIYCKTPKMGKTTFGAAVEILLLLLAFLSWFSDDGSSDWCTMGAPKRTQHFAWPFCNTAAELVQTRDQPQ